MCKRGEKMKYTKLEKQLIMLSVMGINITIADGHRWIEFNEYAEYDEKSIDLLEKSISCKVYGGIKEAIIRIDNLFIKNNMPTLEQRFDENICPKFDIEYIRGEV